MNVRLRTLPAQLQGEIPALPFHHWEIPSSDAVWCEFRRFPKSIHLRFPGLADFEVCRDGHEVCATPVPGLDDATLEHLHLNQVLPLALSAQGFPVFHASGVEFDGKALAFLGVSGRGKSTLATFLALQGAPLITDDGLILDRMGSHYHARPSHPSVRLWEDSEKILVGAHAVAAPAISFTSKARFLTSGLLPQCETPKPLRRAYFIGDGSADSVVISPVGPREAHMMWVEHSFLLDPRDRKRMASHFQHVTHLCAEGLTFVLDYPRRYDALPEVARAIQAHAAI